MNTHKNEGEKVAEEWLKDDGHVGIINVWRPTVRPVEKSPLGFLDVNSVDYKVGSFVKIRINSYSCEAIKIINLIN